MANRKDRDRAGYELALHDVLPTFDPLPLNPKPASTRDWVLESEAAAMLGLTKRALERRRGRGTGPVHHERMGFTAYYLDDLDAWVASKPKAYKPPTS